MKDLRRLLAGSIASGIAWLGAPYDASAEHPGLLFTADDLDELQARAEAEPWATMLTEAVEASAASYDAGASVRVRLVAMTSILEGAALAWLVDVEDRELYEARALAAIAHFDDIYPAPVSGDHDYDVDGGSAFVAAVLALDLMHPTLDASQLADAEASLAVFADGLAADPATAFPTNEAGVAAIWALYRDESTDEIDARVATYRDAIEAEIGVDGPYDEGSGYADARMGGTRLAKAYALDIIDFTGADDWYDDPRMRGFVEWQYGGTITPLGQLTTFGDTEPTRNAESTGSSLSGPPPATRRAHRFSELAGRNAAWSITLSGGEDPSGSLLGYVLQDRALAEPAPPTSRVWPSGSAALWADASSGTGLMAALWSPTGTGGHAHKDVNAIHVTGYGEQLLRNVGYAGWENGCAGKDWAWVHDTAEANNTVTYDGIDHPRKVGGGITESLSSLGFDYASASSGSALSKTTHHQRSLVLVHPDAQLPGYFALFDVLDGLGGSFAMALHPAATQAITRTEGTDYDFAIVRPAVDGPVPTPAALRVFYATTPGTVELRDGAMCAFDDKSFASTYLHATYPATPNGTRMVTVLFPHDDTHAAAAIERIDDATVNGARIDLGDGVVDTAVSSSSAEPVVVGEISVRAIAAMFRTDAAGLAFYFVRTGWSFDDGAEARTGFSATLPVSLHMRGDEGRITSATASTVTFFAPGLGSVTVDPEGAAVVIEGDVVGEVTVELDAGAHALVFGMGGAAEDSGSGGSGDGDGDAGSASASASGSASGGVDEGSSCGDDCRGGESDGGGAVAGADSGCGCVVAQGERIPRALLIGGVVVMVRSRRRRARR